jgi:hypothetical protein
MKHPILRLFFITAIIAAVTPQSLQADGVDAAGMPLYSMSWFGQQPTVPPLNTSVMFARKTSEELCRGCTGEILSLIYEQSETENLVHPWPFYVQLDTAHAEGDATGTNARIYNRSTGWAAAHHGEVIAYSAGSVNIGSNLEISPMAAGNRMIGLNLQAKNGYSGETPGHWSSEAVNIQSDSNVGWMTGIEFDRVRMGTGIDFSPGSSGTNAIRIRGAYNVGLDMGANNIRLNAGAKACFEATDRICIRYNAKKSRLEFMNGSSLLAYLNTAKAEPLCLNC